MNTTKTGKLNALALAILCSALPLTQIFKSLCFLMAEMHTLTLHRLAWVVVPRAAAESQRHLDLLCCLPFCIHSFPEIIYLMFDSNRSREDHTYTELEAFFRALGKTRSSLGEDGLITATKYYYVQNRVIFL